MAAQLTVRVLISQRIAEQSRAEQMAAPRGQEGSCLQFQWPNPSVSTEAMKFMGAPAAAAAAALSGIPCHCHPHGGGFVHGWQSAGVK